MKNVSLLIKSDKGDRFDYGMMTKNTDIFFNLSCKDYEVEYATILLIQADLVLKTNWKLNEDNIGKKLIFVIVLKLYSNKAILIYSNLYIMNLDIVNFVI